MTTKKERADLGELPAELESSRTKLELLALETGPESWPKGEGLVKAPQIGVLAGLLIQKLHPELREDRMAYLWREKLTKAGRIDLGKPKKAGALLRLLAGVDFVVTLNWSAWQELTPRQRLALLDHELEHCTTDQQSGAPRVRHHDLEEFTSVVERWGAWTPDLAEFKAALEQLDIFEPAGVGETG